MGRKKELTITDSNVALEIAFAVRVPESLYAPININCIILEYCLSELGSPRSWNPYRQKGLTLVVKTSAHVLDGVE